MAKGIDACDVIAICIHRMQKDFGINYSLLLFQFRMIINDYGTKFNILKVEHNIIPFTSRDIPPHIEIARTSVRFEFRNIADHSGSPSLCAIDDEYFENRFGG